MTDKPDPKPPTKAEVRDALRQLDAMQRSWAKGGIGGWHAPARRHFGSRNRLRWQLVDAIHQDPAMTDEEIIRRGHELDPKVWPVVDDWHSREAQRKRIERLRKDAADK